MTPCLQEAGVELLVFLQHTTYLYLGCIPTAPQLGSPNAEKVTSKILDKPLK